MPQSWTPAGGGGLLLGGVPGTPAAKVTIIGAASPEPRPPRCRIALAGGGRKPGYRGTVSGPW